MQRIAEIDKPALRLLRSEIEAALRPLAEKHGIDFGTGRCKYTGANATIEVKISVRDAEGNIRTREAEDYKRLAASCGLKAEWLGAEFTSQGRTLRITGLNPKAVKYPVLARDIADGQGYKFRAEVIKDRMTLGPAVNPFRIPRSG